MGADVRNLDFDYAAIATCTLAGLFIAQACQARVSSSSTDSLPPMHATHIPDSVAGPIEITSVWCASNHTQNVKGFRVFQAGDCTVWRFTDSVGVHYLAEGRRANGPVACAVAR